MPKETQFLIWNEETIKQAADYIQTGEVVAFPTETVYGLGADATNPDAVAKIFEAKGRPADNPLIVHVASIEQIEQYVADVPADARRLINAFMPGPLTIILPNDQKIAHNVTAGLETVAIRIPDHPAAQELIQEARRPIAAPSANISGKPSPTNAIHVFQDLNGKISAILDGGSTGIGLESTVVDCTGEKVTIIRPGNITQSDLEGVLNYSIDTTDSNEAKPKSPGIKYTHYQPEVPLTLVDGDPDFFQRMIDHDQASGKRVGVLVSEELATKLSANHIQVCGTRENLATIASQLYQSLRAFKQTNVDVILAEAFPNQEIGQAIMNRLTKASSQIKTQENDR